MFGDSVCVWTLIFVSLPAAVVLDTQCHCSVFISLPNDARGEEIIKGDQGSVDCSIAAGDTICKQNCLRTLSNITSEYKLKVIPSKLSAFTTSALCSGSFRDEELATSLRLGSYYKGCKKIWSPLGIVRQQKICCRGSHLIQCSTPVYSSFSRTRKNRSLNNQNASESAEIQSWEAISNRWKSVYNRYSRFLTTLMNRYGIKMSPSLTKMMHSGKHGLHQIMDLIGYKKQSNKELNETQEAMLKDPDSMINRAGKLYLDYFHELGFCYCYVEYLAKFLWLNNDVSGRAFSLNDISPIVKAFIPLLGKDSSNEFNIFVDQVFPLLSDMYNSPIVKSAVNNFFLKPTKKVSQGLPNNYLEEDETLESFNSEETENSDTSDNFLVPSSNGVTSTLMNIVQKILISAFNDNGEQKIKIDPISSKKPLHNKVKNPTKSVDNDFKNKIEETQKQTFKDRVHDKMMEVLRTVFMSVFGVVPGHYYTKLDKLLIPLLTEKSPEVFFTPPPRSKQLRLINRSNLDKRFDGSVDSDKRSGILYWLSKLDDSSSGLHCIKNYAVNKLFKMASRTVHTVLSV